MEVTAINFNKNNGPGYYSSIQRQSYDGDWVEMRFEGVEEECSSIPFTYWENDTPICDYYCNEE